MLILEDIERLTDNQQEILQMLNNGLKSRVEENGKGLEKLEGRFNKMLLAIGGGMFTIILMLVGILIRLG